MDLVLFALLFLGPRLQTPEKADLTANYQPTQTVNSRHVNQMEVPQAELDRRQARDRRIAAYRQKYGNTDAQINKRESNEIAPPSVKSTARESLNYRVDFSFFKQDMTLEDAFAALTNIGVPLVVMWRDLEENAFVDKATTIGVDGSGIMSVENVLELILRSVSPRDTELAFSTEGGIITVGSKETVAPERVLRVYDVAELSGTGFWFGDQDRYNGSNRGHQNHSGNGGSNRGISGQYQQFGR